MNLTRLSKSWLLVWAVVFMFSLSKMLFWQVDWMKMPKHFHMKNSMILIFKNVFGLYDDPHYLAKEGILILNNHLKLSFRISWYFIYPILIKGGLLCVKKKWIRRRWDRKGRLSLRSNSQIKKMLPAYIWTFQNIGKGLKYILQDRY